ncbi:hypothetical protein [Methylomonas methanica]|uniref:Uncharacterized protein n=1 Tax=Methylomonas methanica (strain DSM 25384 / MC09) TaxID=857087 RepID=F9ZVH3_METMM|nr:hypothetical protein [Methylomonas methanica]AEG01955.1 hypothetical protein Metme_3591 [Methylomonas methanica MC09]
MRNYIHNIAKYTALVLISALPFSIDAYAESKQTSRMAPVEVNLDGDLIETNLIKEQKEQEE